MANGTGIKVIGGSSSFQQKVVGNAVFAATPIRADAHTDNITDTFTSASNYLVNPAGDLGILDLYPKVGMLSETPIQTSSFDGAFTESSRDYNGDLHNELIRVAYAGEGVNPGWLPKLERKPQPHDDIPPSPPTGLKIRVF